MYVGYLFILTVLFVACAEVVVRTKGVKPWRPDSDDIVSFIDVDPGGRFFHTHAVLGYSHLPGKFSVAVGPPTEASHGQDGRFRFTVTHLPNTLRITRPLESYSSPERKEDIWIFGCSVTHGWSVNDHETYSWLLQNRFPEYNVVNFGVSGYGTIHSLLQFRDALTTKTPKVVVLAYASFHDARNTFARTRRKYVVAWNKLGPLVQPYARLDEEGRLQYYAADALYAEFPLMRHLAFAHFIEMIYDDIEAIRVQSRAVSEALILEMSRMAEQRGVKFIVASVSGTPMTEFYSRHGIRNINMAVDPGRPENTNLPHDSHPSAFAHQQYAGTLEPVLKAALGLGQ